MQHFYRALGRYLSDPRLLFLNYGYLDPSSNSQSKGSNRYHINLLNRVLGDSPTTDGALLEIGCGRGGNCSHLANRTKARTVVGLDLCTGNIEFCHKTHRANNLHFLIASADSVPFRNGTFDLVLNLESAHCYADFGGFLAEVKRVLRPGGRFCFADLWGLSNLRVDWARRERLLGSCGLEVIDEEDISERVLDALQQTDGFTSKLRELSNRHNRHFVDRIIHGNWVTSNALSSGKCCYRLWRFASSS